VGVADPNKMRDKRILELKAKHNFYIMPTFNNNNLRLYTKKYSNEYDNDNLTVYSGGGYIAKSKLGNSFSNRRRVATAGSKRSSQYTKSRRRPRRFNEGLDTVSQKSVNRRRALSRGSGRHNYNKMAASYQAKPKSSQEEKYEVKKKIFEKIEKMTEDEIDKISKQLDEISKQDQRHRQNEDVSNEFEKEEIMKEEKDKVGDLPEPGEYKKEKSITELSEYGSQKPRNLNSVSSKRSSKTYISQLRMELEQEKAQRLKLESEIEELKKLSSEISSRLGISPGK
jgi:hypothetical protein